MLLLCTDFLHAGRPDADLLTDTQRMQLFFTPDDFDAAHALLEGDADSACSWRGVQCLYEGEDVATIIWMRHYFILEGSIDFRMTPTHIDFLSLSDQKLTGTIETAALPASLVVFTVHRCLFSGALHLHDLPPKMNNFSVTGNRITALGDIRNVPVGLIELEVFEENNVVKQIHVGMLPDSELKVRLHGCGVTQVMFKKEGDLGRVSYE